MRLFIAAFVVVSVSGCVMNPLDATTTTTAPLPGTAIGTYSVSAIETQNTCGEGALGETPSWAFTVSFSRDGSTVYWDSGSGPITGVSSPDNLTFSFLNTIVTDMRPPIETNTDPTITGFGVGGAPVGPPLPPCSLQRNDTASGAFSSSVDPVLSFTGSLSYAYAPTAGSICTDLITGTPTTPPSFLTLPCGMSFALTGTRE